MTDDEPHDIEKEARIAGHIMDAIDQNLNLMHAPMVFRIGLFSSLLLEAFRAQRETDNEVGRRNMDKFIQLASAMRDAPDAASMQAVMEATADVIDGQKTSKH